MCIEKREIARQNSRWLSRGKDAGQRAHRELAHPLPVGASQEPGRRCQIGWTDEQRVDPVDAGDCFDILDTLNRLDLRNQRSEEHTSELQSLMRTSYAVCCLKKKKEKIEH